MINKAEESSNKQTMKSSKMDVTIDEASEETFPASDAPAWSSKLDKLNHSQKMSSSPLGKLEREHSIIMKFIYALCGLQGDLKKNKYVGTELIMDMIDFMKNYIDNYHHKKENEILFPLLENSTIQLPNALLAILKHDHKLCEQYTSVLENARKLSMNNKEIANTLLLATITKIKDLLPIHMMKESTFLYDIVESSLPPETKQILFNQLEQFDAKQDSTEINERLPKLAQELYLRFRKI